MSNRYRWTHQLDRLLESGYREGRCGVVRAINNITTMTGWPRQACYDRGRKLGLSAVYGTGHRRWTTAEEELLIRKLGVKAPRTIALELGRTAEAVRQKIIKAGYRRRTDNLSKQRLADTLHISRATVQRWIDHGWIVTQKEGPWNTVSIYSLGHFIEHHLSEINVTLLTEESCQLLLHALFEYRSYGERQ